MDNGDGRYAAFISYRHLARDRHWAQWLIRELEAFRTPRSLVKRGYPARIGKLFRDQDELAASPDLNDQIRQALHRSSALIVVCSPDTPKSLWVSREIELFQELGKADRVFPLLIAGEPDQSFPRQLRYRHARLNHRDGTEGRVDEEFEPFAADVRPRSGDNQKNTERQALLRLAAATLGCGYDDLAQRDAARRRQRARRMAVSMLGATAVSGLIGTWWWDANVRVKTQHCTASAEYWGVPNCVGAVPTDVAQTQSYVWRLTSKAGRVLEAVRINGRGGLVDAGDWADDIEPWNWDAARWTYTYRDDGALNRVVQFDRTGHQLRQVAYEVDRGQRRGLVRFEHDLGVADRQKSGATFLGVISDITASENQSARSLIGQHRLLFDDTGLLQERRFEPSGGGTSRADASGAYGRAYRYTSSGLIASLRNLDAFGDALVENNSTAGLTRDCDSSGRLIAVTWRNKNGEPIENSEGYTRIVFERDSLGRSVRVKYFDADGHPALKKTTGVSSIDRIIDERGSIAEWIYFGIDGKPVLSKDTGVSHTIVTFDARGNPIEQRYYGLDENPVSDKQTGAARVTWLYDERGNTVQANYFGIDSNPTLSKDWGAARITWVLDDRGKVTETAYFGVDGKPILNRSSNVARTMSVYDERGNLVEQAYFGSDGHPTANRLTGAARENWVYDPTTGNRIELAYFGLKGELVVCTT